MLIDIAKTVKEKTGEMKGEFPTAAFFRPLSFTVFCGQHRRAVVAVVMVEWTIAMGTNRLWSTLRAGVSMRGTAS